MTGVFLKLIERIVSANVDFVLVGGFAGVVHGCSCLTSDIDICMDFSTENLSRLKNALDGINPIHRMNPKKIPLELTEASSTQFKNLYLSTDMGQLDCISYVNGVGDFNKVKNSTIAIDVDGVEIRVLDIETLIEAKKAMARQKDNEAIMQLETIRKMKEK